MKRHICMSPVITGDNLKFQKNTKAKHLSPDKHLPAVKHIKSE